jgi:hypothetical protein
MHCYANSQTMHCRAIDLDPPKPSMVDKMQRVVDATKDLRSDSGNLSLGPTLRPKPP